MNSEKRCYKCFIHGPDGLDIAYHLTRAQVGELLLLLGEAEPETRAKIDEVFETAVEKHHTYLEKQFASNKVES